MILKRIGRACLSTCKPRASGDDPEELAEDVNPPP